MKTYIVLVKCITGPQSVFQVKIQAESYDYAAVTNKDVKVVFQAGGKVVGEFFVAEIYGFMLAVALG